MQGDFLNGKNDGTRFKSFDDLGSFPLVIGIGKNAVGGCLDKHLHRLTEDQLPDMSGDEWNSSFPRIFILPPESYTLCHDPPHFCEVQNYGIFFFKGQSSLYKTM
jgi:hypothetical protein